MLKPNPFNWISIPAANLDRAIDFYNAVFELSLEKVEMMGDELAFFSMDPEAHGATGAITTGPNSQPGMTGPVVFFGCEDDLQNALDRVADAGGEGAGPQNSRLASTAISPSSRTVKATRSASIPPTDRQTRVSPAPGDVSSNAARGLYLGSPCMRSRTLG